MLVSHACRFVYIKTPKTAGTSVESFLEPFCTPPGHVVAHGAAELVTPYGVVGWRGKRKRTGEFQFKDHMSAVAIRDALPEVFATYTRIANVRNPYDKAISHFHHMTRMKPAEAAQLARHAPAELRRQFHEHAAQGIPSDRLKLLIDGEVIVDRVIRFEHLVADLEQLNVDLKLGVVNVSDALPSFKLTTRKSSGPDVAAYLSPQAIAIVNRRMGWYFDKFNYTRLDEDAAGRPDQVREQMEVAA